MLPHPFTALLPANEWCQSWMSSNMTPIEKIRNVAIIAHIDHGKTTLIDSIFRATRVFRENAQIAERVMDNN